MFVVIKRHVWQDRRYGTREQGYDHAFGPFADDASGRAWLESKGFKASDRHTYWRQGERLGQGEIARVTHVQPDGA